MSPNGTVTSTFARGLHRAPATNANSTRESSGTSSSTSGARQIDRRRASPLSPRPRVAVANSVARSRAVAAANCSSNRSSRAARSGPPSGSRASASGADLGEAQLLQRAGERAREAGRLRDRLEVRQRAVLLRIEGGARRDRLGSKIGGGRKSVGRKDGEASRAASWVRLKRCRPIVAPVAAAIERDRSSTAPRDAPTTWTSEPLEICAETKARASASRSSVADDSTIRMWGGCEDLPRAICSPSRTPCRVTVIGRARGRS